MPCPNCGHTMGRLGCQVEECRGSFWCPRCGTLLIRHGPPIPGEDAVAPTLAYRCRDFEKILLRGAELSPAFLLSEWKRLGVAEAINLPANRPQ